MKKVSHGLTCAILSISLLTVMAGAAVAPALDTIAKHFSTQGSMLTQLIVSMPALFIIASTLLFRPLCKVMGSRSIALVGLLLYVVAGVGAFIVNDIYVLLILRAALGVSVGMIMPLSTGLLSYYFPPEQQSKLMGLSAAMNQLGGVVATMLAGVLATIDWNYPFLVYAAGLIAVVLVAIFLPNDHLAMQNTGFSAKQLIKFHPSVTAMLLIMVLFFVYPTNFATTANANGVGTVATTIIMVGLDVVAFAMGLLFPKLMRMSSHAVKYIPPVFFMAGYACLCAMGGLSGMIVGSALIGVANGIGVPYVNTIASIKGGKDAAVTVMPMISAALYLGQFISPLLISPLSQLLDIQNAQYAISVTIAAVYLLQAFLTRKHHALPK
ncbi:MAG: MFS transporter [Bacteroidales bacterium]|nr:MFS transporter [Bacteroidales bacterium]